MGNYPSFLIIIATSHNIYYVNFYIQKRNTYIYPYSDLTGEPWDYLANTTVEILENLVDVDKVRVIKTGRVGYVYKVDAYKQR